MSHDGSQTDRNARIRQAAEKVLADESFVRAQVMSRLLVYLVDRTVESVAVKSYTIAIEALGRDEGDLVDADTYARVTVARLRKALISYFANHPSEEEIYIDTGTYEVLIRNPDTSDMEAIAEQRAPNASRRRLPVHLRTYLLRYVVGCLAFLASVTAIYLLDVWRAQEHWASSDFPTLTVMLDRKEGTARPYQELDTFRNALRQKLPDYIGFRLIEAGEVRADYEITLDVDQLDNREVRTVSLVETATQRLVWISQYSFSDQADISRNAALAATAIAAPGGALNSFGRSKQLSSRSPYGCWLRFTESVMSYSSIVDSEVHSCAEDWYAFDETNPVAAFLRNWSMVSASNTILRQSSRHAELEEALVVAHRALARNPDNAMLYIAEMRTYSFLGARNQVQQSAESALASAPDNRVICGMVGTWLIFWNDPRGEEILGDLAPSPVAALAWEHAGHFIAAMMRDDVQGAIKHMSHLRFYMEGQPALNLLEAAYAGRTGGPQSAEVALNRLKSQPQAWFVGPEEIIARLPFAPEVKARLEEWIAYKPTQTVSE